MPAGSTAEARPAASAASARRATSGENVSAEIDGGAPDELTGEGLVIFLEGDKVLRSFTSEKKTREGEEAGAGGGGFGG